MYILSDYLKIILELASYLMVKWNGTCKDICTLSCLLTNEIRQGTKAYTNWKRRSKILFIHDNLSIYLVNPMDSLKNY